jgi:hypothetical protein
LLVLNEGCDAGSAGGTKGRDRIWLQCRARRAKMAEVAESKKRNGDKEWYGCIQKTAWSRTKRPRSNSSTTVCTLSGEDAHLRQPSLHHKFRSVK